MKILLVTKLYSPWIGGVERHVQDLAEGLLKEGHDVKVLCCQEPIRRMSGDGKRETGDTSRLTIDNPQLIKGVPIYKAPSLGLLWSMPISFAFPFWLRNLAAESDIIHFHFPFPLALLSWEMLSCFAPVSRLPSPVSFVTWHSDIVRQKWAAKVIGPLMNRFLRGCQRIIVSSQRMQECSKQLGPHAAKAAVIPMALDTRRYALSDKLLSKALEIRERFGGVPLLLFAGRLVPYKGVDVAIKAFAQVIKNCHFVIIGNGPLKGSLEMLAAELGIGGRISFLNFQETEGLLPYFHACDFLVLPSVHPNEAFGLVQIEAMACGKPVINTNLPTGVPGVSLHEHTGLTVEPGNVEEMTQAMSRLISNPDLLLRFGQNARLRALDNFDLPSMISRTTEIYKTARLRAIG